MREEKKQLFLTLEESFRESLDDMSVSVGIRPEPIYGDIEYTGPGEVYIAIFGIRTSEVRLNISVIAAVPVVSGVYFQGYADVRGELLDDEVGLFSEFADALAKEAMNRSGLDDIQLPPCQIMGGENLSNKPSNKASVISFSLPYELPEGKMFINVAVSA